MRSSNAMESDVEGESGVELEPAGNQSNMGASSCTLTLSNAAWDAVRPCEYSASGIASARRQATAMLRIEMCRK